MDYIALYRKWRPMTFDDVVEQSSVVTILKNSVKTRRIAHAYLFCGTRGTGKTSIAKIFSRAINCLNPIDGNPCNECDVCKGILNESLLDVSEIDAASNNGVDSIRDIIDESSYQAARAEYKVFIIDEVHMLSTAAFNALLKTLEEPPEKVVFILATTEPHKLPVTILSRCQRYDFKRISRDGIVSRLKQILDAQGTTYDESALRYIAGKADGAMRDAISLLDQTLSSVNGNVSLDDARKSTGSLDRETIESFARGIIGRDGFTILTLVEKIFSEGADPSNFICELIDLFREMMIILSTKNAAAFLYETEEDIKRIKQIAQGTNTKEITMIIRELSSLENTLKWSVQRKIIFEAGMLSLCDRNWSKDTELFDRVQTLERDLADLAANGLKVQYRGGAPVQFVSETEVPENSEETVVEKPHADKNSLTDEVLRNLESIPDTDWKEFLQDASDNNPGVGGILSACDAKGYIINGTLFIPISDEKFVKMLSTEKNNKVLKESSSASFGQDLNVIVMEEKKFYEQAPDLIKNTPKASEKEENDEINAMEESLEELGSKLGFTVTTSDGEETSPEEEKVKNENRQNETHDDSYSDEESLAADSPFSFEPPDEDEAPEEFP